VVRRAAVGGDERVLRREILELVRAVVPFDSYAWVLTDPLTCVGSSPVAETPRLADLPQLVRLKYLTTVNRWTAIGDPPVVTLRGATDGDLSRSLVWRELLHTYDVSDVLSCVCRDRHGCWAFLDLWRTGSNGCFADDEVTFLTDVVQSVTAALRRCVADALVAPTRMDPASGPVVLLLSEDLEVRARTPPAADYLRALVPAAPDAEPVPAVAYNVAAQLVARETGVDDHPPLARTHLAGDRLVSVRADRVEGGSGSSFDIAVTIEPASAAERVDLFARAFGLTQREAELVGAIAGGGDTRDLARTMQVSENTVQDHLKSVFGKTSARSRTQLLAWVRGS
jgi:DNA-binding CsgD family transcriptional regulator